MAANTHNVRINSSWGAPRSGRSTRNCSAHVERFVLSRWSDRFMAHLPKHSPSVSPGQLRKHIGGACTVALQWTIRIIAIGVCPASHSHHTSNVALAKQPHTQHLTVGMGPVGRGDIDWKHARPLVAAVATGGSECGCASPVCPQAGYVSSWHFCDVRSCPLHGRFRRQSGPQPAAGSRLRAHGQNSSGQDDPSRHEPRVLAPAPAGHYVGGTGRVVAPSVARLRPLTPRRHTPLHAATPRYQ